MNKPDLERPFAHGAQPVRRMTKPLGSPRIQLLAGRRRAIWILLTLIFGGLLLWAVRQAQNVHKGTNRFGRNGPIPVGTAIAIKGDVAVMLDALGAVTPLATVVVKPQVSGILQKIDFREGQAVKSGDVLAEIDPRPFRAALDQAKGQLQRDQAQLANAWIDLRRYQQLWSQKAISQQILATQTALVRTDSGTVKADEAAVETADLNVSYTKVTAPVTGRVGLRQVDVGNLMQPGVTPEIAVVTQMQPISVIFTLPEDDIGEVMQRVRSGASLAVDVYDRSQTVKLAAGRLATVDNEIDPTTGTVKMRAVFDNANNGLFPSQFVNVRLLVETLRGQTVIPTAAIQRGASGNYVFVIGTDDKARMRSVALGPVDGDKLDVTAGLKPGERVVVDGADRLSDGAHVLLPDLTSRSRASGAHAAGPRIPEVSGRSHHRRHASDPGHDAEQNGSP